MLSFFKYVLRARGVEEGRKPDYRQEAMLMKRKRVFNINV